MLEHQYGLLGPDEERELNEYLATTEGATLKTRAQAWTAQLQGAARESFPDVQFSAPAIVIPNPSTNSDRLMIRQVWSRWAVAACLMIVLGGMGAPAAYQFIGWSAQSYETAQLRADASAKRDAVRKLEAEQQITREQIRKGHEQAQVAQRESEKAFNDALANARKAIEAKEFTVRLRGPDRIQPGAPNEWQIDTLTKSGAYASPKKIEVVVRDQKDTELLRETHADSRGSTSLKLAADFWKNVKPGSDLYLEVVAYADDDRKSVLAERVPLARPVYVTHLVTDKPLYKPGEIIRFRSLTLDRSTFLPPAHDMNLQFFIRNPDKARFQIDEGNGRVLNGLLPVVGPDGKPVRGIGTGEYQLGLNAPGGEYTLEIEETEEIKGKPPRKTLLDTRRFLVNTYVPDTFEKRLEFDGKSYGPGDAVQARVEVSRTAGGPMKDARADIVAKLSNGKVLFTAKGVRLETVTDPGTRQTKAVHNLRFKLPDDLFVNRPANAPPLTATLTVTIQDGSDAETIVRPIPFVEKDLRIEFFPEGGDLVEGLPSRVYFQVRMPSGKPADLKGSITDGTNKLFDIATITDPEQPGVNRGQGLFTFTPEAGKKYFLKLVSPVGMNEPTKEGFPLPVAKAEGVVLKTLDAVTEKGQVIRVQVQVAKGPKILHIGAYARGRLISHQRIEMDAGKPTEVKLQGDESLGGVTRITVFEEPKTEAGKKITLIPLAERLVYRKPGEQLILSANPDKARYSPAGKVALELSALNEEQNPTPAILLVGVVNQSIIAMADNKTDRLLPTHFLLAGDVKNPADLEHADFLLTDHPKAAVALDILLGTQGWRRFAEQNILPTNPVEKREVERMLVAHGQMTTAPLELFKLEEKRIAAEFMPKVEQAGIRSAISQNAWVKFQQEDEPKNRSTLASAKAHAESLDTQHTAAAAELYKFETRFDRIRGVALPLLVIGLLVLAFGGIAFAVVRCGRERKPFVRTAAASFAMAALVIVAVFFTRATPEAERAYVKLKADQQMAKTGYNPPRMNAAPAGGVMNPEFAPVRDPLPAMPAPKGPKDNGFKPPVRAKAGPELREVEVQRMREAARMVANKPVRDRFDPAVAETMPPEDSPLMPFVVREYAHERDPSFGNVRADFTETVYWHPVLVLPDSGKTTVHFQLSDDIARYQILVAGHTTDGRIGAITKTIEARKPFTVDPKLPLEVSHTDTIDVPIRVVNDSDDRRAINFTVTPYNLAVEGGALKTPAGLWKDTIDLAANGKGRKIFRLKPTILEGDATLTVLGNSDPAAEPDAVGRLMRVVPEGFPFIGSFSDMLETRASGSVVLPKDMVKGTLKIRLEVYPTSMADLVKGLDGLLREPSGCFEQTSTTNYPNTLILDYLNQSNQVNPQATARAKELLDKGYSKLAGFECPDTPAKLKQGFEWFGSPDRAHEALTAYGLLQFKDMARVHHVDPELIKRTQAFLLSRRDGEGGFKRNAQALDSFGGAAKHTTDAYIVWALVESDPDDAEKLDLKKEIATIKAEALNETSRGGKDAYFVALTANVLLQRDDRETAMKLLDRLKGKHFKAGAVTGGETSITRSGGRDLDIETTALAMLGWLRSNETKYAGTLKESTTWLSQQRGGQGGFGSTQSTIMALKALILHAKKNAHPTEAGEIKLLVGGKVIGTKIFSETEIEVIAFNVDKAEEIFAAGAKTDVEIVTEAKHPYPFALSYTYTTLTPASAEKCAVKLETKLGRNEATEGETVPLTVSLQNLQKQGQGMAVAIVGLPAGMKVPTDMKQLTELREKGIISFFEMRGRELILYWRELAPEQKIDVNLELICEVPGQYRGPASRGYLYYNADHKHWVEPVAMRIQPMGPAGEKVAER